MVYRPGHPHGGFGPTRPAREAKLLDILEAINGPSAGGGLLAVPISVEGDCPLRDTLPLARTRLRVHLPKTVPEYVLVNGQIVLESGRYTGAKPGKVLRGPGCQKPQP